MTQVTGNEPQEQTKPAPWEQSWIPKPVQAVVDFFSGSKSPTEGSKQPWERDWKLRGRESTGKVQKAPEGFNIDSYIRKTAAVESSNNPEAKAKTSSATGLFQFTAGTWNDMVKELGLNYTLADRKDPEKSEQVMRAFTEKNVAKAKEALGRTPTNTEVYMYHFLGRSAPKLLTANPEDDAVDHVTKSQARANKSVFFSRDGKPKKVKDILERYTSKYGD